MKHSPKIIDMKWGEIETEAGTFRDAKLWPGDGRNWDWNEAGTSHTPGIQIADVSEIVEEGSKIIIIGNGQNEKLDVKDEAKKLLTDKGIEFEIINSQEAVKRYNKLVEREERVGALIHTTC